MYRVHSELLHQEFTNCGPYPQVINLMLSDEPIINVFRSMEFSKSVSCTIRRCVLSEMATYTANYTLSKPEDNIQGVSRLEDITAGGDFLGLCDQKSSYKHVSDFGRLRSYDRLKLRRDGNDY